MLILFIFLFWAIGMMTNLCLLYDLYNRGFPKLSISRFYLTLLGSWIFGPIIIYKGRKY